MIEVSGYCSSRLDELRKYAVSGPISSRFFIATDASSDGVNPYLSVEGVNNSQYIYYIGGITYEDQTSSGVTVTTFHFESLGLDEGNNFENLPVVKLESKQNMVENPQVERDVFIERQQQPVFERNYRLRAVNAVNDVLSYAGGNYFTIYNNT